MYWQWEWNPSENSFCSIIQENWKLAKSSILSAYNSKFFHSNSIEINTIKLRGNEKVLVAYLVEKLPSLESDQKYAKRISEEEVTDCKAILI